MLTNCFLIRAIKIDIYIIILQSIKIVNTEDQGYLTESANASRFVSEMIKYLANS